MEEGILDLHERKRRMIMGAMGNVSREKLNEMRFEDMRLLLKL